jgi:hypothetical protein
VRKKLPRSILTILVIAGFVCQVAKLFNLQYSFDHFFSFDLKNTPILSVPGFKMAMDDFLNIVTCFLKNAFSESN